MCGSFAEAEGVLINTLNMKMGNFLVLMCLDFSLKGLNILRDELVETYVESFHGFTEWSLLNPNPITLLVVVDAGCLCKVRNFLRENLGVGTN